MKEGSQGWNEEEQRVHIESRVLSKIATISFTVSFFFIIRCLPHSFHVKVRVRMLKVVLVE